MEESALAAPALCQNPVHLHALPSPFVDRTTLRQEGGEALALSGIAHDARNLVTALRLCAELISEPGVLGPTHEHYAREVRSIAQASDRLVRRLSALSRSTKSPREATPAETPVQNVAEAVQQLAPLLAAVAGPAIEIEIVCLPCAGLLQLSDESLTRILLNLVRNAADAIPGAGHIRVTVQGSGGSSFLWTVPGLPADLPASVVLSVEDDGPGIPAEMLERIFEAGFSTRKNGAPWPEARHRGLGLSIVRQLVEQAGGTVRAVVPPRPGARFEIELPLTNVTPSLPSEHALTEGGAL